MGTRKRIRVAEGTYADKNGIAATVKVGEQQKERRFPPGTDQHVIDRWREETRIRLRFNQPKGRRGTFAGDADRYLKQVAHLASAKARRVEVMAWVKALPDEILRDNITAQHVRTIRAHWLTAGSSPKTCNNRVQTLRHLFRTLDGPDYATPCDAVTPLPVQKTPPVYVTAETILTVDRTLETFEREKRVLSAKTRARFRVYASTGKRPCEIMRAQLEDVDLERRVWIVRDAKGGASPGLYLNDDQLAAWQFFIAADAWGKFDTNSFARTLRSAGWPAGVKPYNLRHTTWIEASERGADLADIQAGAGHKHLATTRRHYVPVLNSRMQKLSERLDGRFGWTLAGSNKTAPAALPAPHNSIPQNVRESRSFNADGQRLAVGEKMRIFLRNRAK
jgi:integrase